MAQDEQKSINHELNSNDTEKNIPPINMHDDEPSCSIVTKDIPSIRLHWLEEEKENDHTCNRFFSAMGKSSIP